VVGIYFSEDAAGEGIFEYRLELDSSQNHDAVSEKPCHGNIYKFLGPQLKKLEVSMYSTPRRRPGPSLAEASP